MTPFLLTRTHPLLDPCIQEQCYWFTGHALYWTYICCSNPRCSGQAECNVHAVCLLHTAAEFVCGRLSERPSHCDERHLDLPIHFTFAPINYSTGQPIKNEGERSGPRPPKAATRQLSLWIIGAINLALSNKGLLTLPSCSIALSLSPCVRQKPSTHQSLQKHITTTHTLQQ